MSDPSAKPLELSDANAIMWLNRLLEFYSGQEAEYYQKIWGGTDPNGWRESTQNEWMRYRQEAAALRAGIKALELSQRREEGL